MKAMNKLNPDFRILYFSGTGNTQWVVEQIKKGLKTWDFRVFSTPIDELLAEAGRAYGSEFDPQIVIETLKKLTTPGTTLILAYPVYSCDMPIPVKEIVNLLPPTHDCNLAVIATCYVAGGKAASLPEKLLNHKGYTPVLGWD